jgi:hypothetical protein
LPEGGMRETSEQEIVVQAHHLRHPGAPSSGGTRASDGARRRRCERPQQRPGPSGRRLPADLAQLCALRMAMLNSSPFAAVDIALLSFLGRAGAPASRAARGRSVGAVPSQRRLIVGASGRRDGLGPAQVPAVVASAICRRCLEGVGRPLAERALTRRTRSGTRSSEMEPSACLVPPSMPVGRRGAERL